MDAQRYQVTQDNKDYIISISLINNKIRIECQDNNYPSSQIYRGEYTLNDLISINNIFNYTPSLFNAQKELNNAIERQQVGISNKVNIIEIFFKIFNQEITFKLFPIPIIQNNNYFQNYQIVSHSPQNLNQTPIINHPIYNIPNKNFQTSYEDDQPDCTYSTKSPQSPQIFQTTQTNIGCGCPLDQERITKIELDSNLLKAEHERLKQRLNNFKSNIQMIKKHASDLRQENGLLNMKTLQLKKIYKQLLEAEVALMAENDDLKRERHELILKKNELDFYIKEQHDHDIVREVNIPIEYKRKRPTNVSKTEKQFGGGYTSSLEKKGHKSYINNQGFNSAKANKSFSSRYNIKDFY